MPKYSHLIKDQDFTPLRLDLYAAEILHCLSRSQIKARRLKAKVNGKDVKISRRVKHGDFLELDWDDLPAQELVPQDIPLDVIFENDQCVVVNKAQGMVVHPGAGNRQGTLANALYFRRLQKGGNENKSIRPGIVHRLDKDTSGVIIAAYNDEAHAFLAEQFKSRKVRKNYIAIVQGEPNKLKGKIETFIARDPADRKRFTVCAKGRYAVTAYKLIKSWKNYSLLLLRPRTGRTHQLRVHLRHIGNPILGDPVYTSADNHFAQASLMLHSKSLAITLPGENDEKVFSASMPDRFIAVMEKLDRMYPHG